MHEARVRSLIRFCEGISLYRGMLERSWEGYCCSGERMAYYEDRCEYYEGGCEIGM